MDRVRAGKVRVWVISHEYSRALQAKISKEFPETPTSLSNQQDIVVKGLEFSSKTQASVIGTGELSPATLNPSMEFQGLCL